MNLFLRFSLPFLALAASLGAQTRVLTNALGTGSTGPAVVVVTAAGRMEFAKLNANLELVSNAAGGLELRAVMPTITVPNERLVVTLFDAPAPVVVELPSAPRSVDSLVVTRNGLVLAAGHDYSLQGRVLAFVPANAPLAGDLFTFRYKE